METVGAVILAAGGSTRLGRPKQLLRHRGESLVRRTAAAACAAGCAPTVVVVGDQWKEIAPELHGLAANLCHHAQWPRGIGSSIRAGVAQALALQPDLAALIVTVCDQPFVTAEIFAALIATRAQPNKRAAACAYAGAVGVPALFDRTHFALLTALPDDRGAKAVLSALADELALVEFPRGVIDIDTPADRRAHLDPVERV